MRAPMIEKTINLKEFSLRNWSFRPLRTLSLISTIVLTMMPRAMKNQRVFKVKNFVWMISGNIFKS